jgi:hypothetical protein
LHASIVQHLARHLQPKARAGISSSWAIGFSLTAFVYVGVASLGHISMATRFVEQCLGTFWNRFVEDCFRHILLKVQVHHQHWHQRERWVVVVFILLTKMWWINLVYGTLFKPFLSMNDILLR